MWSAMVVALITVMACACNGAAPGANGASCRADCECDSRCCVGPGGRIGGDDAVCQQCGRQAFVCDPGKACGAPDVPGVGQCDERACCIIGGEVASRPVPDAQIVTPAAP